MHNVRAWGNANMKLMLQNRVTYNQNNQALHKWEGRKVPTDKLWNQFAHIEDCRYFSVDKIFTVSAYL